MFRSLFNRLLLVLAFRNSWRPMDSIKEAKFIISLYACGVEWNVIGLSRRNDFENRPVVDLSQHILLLNWYANHYTVLGHSNLGICYNPFSCSFLFLKLSNHQPTIHWTQSYAKLILCGRDIRLFSLNLLTWSHLLINCSQTKFVAIILNLFAIFCSTDFSSDSFSSSKTR